MNVLHVPPWAWAATVVALVVLLGADLLLSARRRGPVRLGEAALWTTVMIAAAVAFGALIAVTAGGTAAGQFFAGWLTEYSLSLDNLLVFVFLIGSSAVASRYHGRVLLIGILFALVLRGVLIALGGAALHRFAWVEYLFGAFLIFAAAQMAFRRSDSAGSTGHSRALQIARRVVPVASQGEGAKLTTRIQGRRYATPLLILIIAIAVTDVLLAVDSIPAIFGLTSDPFLVFSANLFALLGLRHLYFLVSGLLTRLVYLSTGLAIILGFIGLKLFSEALRGNHIDHLGPVPVPDVSTILSLTVIAGVLIVVTVSSLVFGRRRADVAGAAQPAELPVQASPAGQPGGDGEPRQPEGDGESARARGTGWAGHDAPPGKECSQPRPAASTGPGRRAGDWRPPTLSPERRGHAAGPAPEPRRPSRRWPAG
jgi:tellurite resistance protein TerC